MPELPEVENYKKYLDGTILNQKITEVEVEKPKITKGGPELFAESLVGERFDHSRRIGKVLFLVASNGKVVSMHFGLTGKVAYFKDEEDRPKYSRVVFHFDSGFKLAYVSMRMFGWLSLADSVDEYKAASKLGDDALEISYEDFHNNISKKKTYIKSVLLDQQITSGIGNWVADEILYQSQIHPETKTSSLVDDDFRNIYEKMRHILSTAIKYEANFDDFPNDFLVPRREEGAKCVHTGDTIVRIEIGGRGTYFSPKWQQPRN